MNNTWEPKIITNYLDGDLKIETNTDGEKIDDFIAKIAAFKEAGATHIQFSVDFDREYVEVSPVVVREETNEEVLARRRMAEATLRGGKAIIEKNERETYLRLKAKYE